MKTQGRDEQNEKMLVEKPEGKRPFGKSRRRWEGNIKTGHKELGLQDLG
jgi:hypothetical protein